MYSILIVLCMSLVALFCPFGNNHTLFAGENMETYQAATFCSLKKKIVIFTFEKGGYGHKAASKSLNELLSGDYDIQTIDLSEHLGAGRIVGGWEIYDKSLRGGWIRSTNAVASYVFPIYLKFFEKAFQTKVSDLLKKEHPDLVISVISYFDGLLFHACKELDLPLLMVTTDGDLMNWVVGLDPNVQPKVKATIGFEGPKTRDLLVKNGLDNDNIFMTGFPIRKDFLEKKDKKAIQQAWNLPQDKFTVLLLMGGVGAAATYRYARRISKMKLPIHLVVCAGSNKVMHKRLERLQKRSNSSMTIVPFTQRISDLMAVSDLLITKAGPGSINEAVYMDLPMLIDKTSTLLRWEEENAAFVERNHFGQSVNSMRSLEKTLKRFFEDKDFYMTFKQHLVEYQKPNFDDNIMRLVQEMCPVPGNVLLQPHRLCAQNQKV